MEDTKPVALTLAGSDSGGGAGIQADIKAMEANGVFATSAITAVTAQNTQTVAMSYNLPERLIAAQIDTVVEDLPVRAAKTGMLSSSAIVRVVARKVREHNLDPLVVDPVMISKSGYRLLEQEAVDTLLDELIPLATIVTPNAQEAALLANVDIVTLDDVRDAARAIHMQGPDVVLVKGGHLEGISEAVDVFYDGNNFREFTAPRIQTKNTHGTGCTFASAIAAHLAHGASAEEAVERAKQYVTEAIRNALSLGKGRGPTNHFHHLDPDTAFATEAAHGSE